MQTLFGIDSTFYRLMDKFTKLVILTMLWLLCSIPIVTMGAATTALYYVTMKLAKGEDCNTIKLFFHSFRSNFRQATIIWVIFVAIGILFGSNYFYYWITGNSQSKGIQYVFLVLLVIYGMALLYIFPVLAKFDNPVKNTIVFSIIMSMVNIGWTVLLTFISIMAVLITLILNGFPVFFAMGIVAWLQSFLFNHIFDKYIQKHQVVLII